MKDLVRIQKKMGEINDVIQDTTSPSATSVALVQESTREIYRQICFIARWANGLMSRGQFNVRKRSE